MHLSLQEKAETFFCEQTQRIQYEFLATRWNVETHFITYDYAASVFPKFDRANMFWAPPNSSFNSTLLSDCANVRWVFILTG